MRCRSQLHVALLAALVTASIATQAMPAGASLRALTTVSRIAGTTPYETAAQAVTPLFPTISPGTVVIASGDPASFERGQLANSLGGVIGKPILFTGTGELATAAAEAITTLDATRAIIVGGVSAVGPAVEASLVAMGLETSRCGGDDIYEDAREVAKATRDLWRGLYPGRVYLVSDDPSIDWRALYALGPRAYRGIPVLFTHHATVPTITLDTMDEIGATSAVILGSDAYVSDEVVEELEGRGLHVDRIVETARKGLAQAAADYITTDG